jgi:effector-binding domain-containing protein
MKNKVILGFTSLLVLGLIWFLFIKEYDYQVNFSIKTSPGTVYSRITQLESWNTTKLEKTIKLVHFKTFKTVDQEVQLKDSIYKIHWELNSVNDSITKVKVFVKDLNHSLKQRLLFLIGKSKFIKNSILFVSNFNLALYKHLKKINVKIIGKSERPMYESIVYVTFNSTLPHKAEKMNQNIFYLMHYLTKHKIHKTGNPFVNVINWDHQNNRINAEFCFPIENLDKYPYDSIVKIKHNIKPVPALKAIYHGNYRYTDRAWFALDNYAKNHNYYIENSILEIYYNDPHNDPNEMHWKADVFIPLKN